MKKTLALAHVATTALNSAAFADGHAITEFRIGVLGGENAQDRMNSYACLQEYASEALGAETKIFAPADYNGVIQGQLGGTLDMAWSGASSYAATYQQDPEAVEPVLVKVNLDGSIGYHSIGFARVDSGIDSIDAMEGKVFGFGDPNSTFCYLIPSIEIPQTKTASPWNPAIISLKLKFTGGHEQTIIAVANGDIDGGVTWAAGLNDNWEDGYDSGALRKAVDAGLVDMSDLVQIWKSAVIPEGPVVVRKSLPADVKATMTDLEDNLYENDPECWYGVVSGEGLDTAACHHFLYRSADYWDDTTRDETFFEHRRSRIAHVGHDTWIGAGAIIKPEVTLGDGAVVAAGAVVTKNVDPYTIVAGTPAKSLRLRQPRTIADRIIALAWWDWDHNALRAALDDFRAMKAEAFLEKYES